MTETATLTLSLKSIHEIYIGNHVLAWYEATNATDWYQVTDTIHHTDTTIVDLKIDEEQIVTTPEHPFYVEGTGCPL